MQYLHLKSNSTLDSSSVTTLHGYKHPRRPNILKRAIKIESRFPSFSINGNHSRDKWNFVYLIPSNLLRKLRVRADLGDPAVTPDKNAARWRNDYTARTRSLG